MSFKRVFIEHILGVAFLNRRAVANAAAGLRECQERAEEWVSTSAQRWANSG